MRPDFVLEAEIFEGEERIKVREFTVFLEEDSRQPCPLFWMHKDFAKMATLLRSCVRSMANSFETLRSAVGFGLLCGYNDVHVFEMRAQRVCTILLCFCSPTMI